MQTKLITPPADWAGGKKGKEMNWIKTSEQLPARKENARYSQVPCIIVKDRQIQILVFNHEHFCWDDEDGDDHNCDIAEVSHWMPLPELPL